MNANQKNVTSKGRAYAFFDVDNTILNFKTMFSFQDFYYRWADPEHGQRESEQFAAMFKELEHSGKDRMFLNRLFYRSYKGRLVEKVRTCTEEWFAFEKKKRGNLYIDATVKALNAHRAEGLEPVFVSGSTVELLAPLARELEVQHCLATRLETSGGQYTGEIDGLQHIGQGKAEAVRRFIAQNEANSEASFAYGDHHTDIPMLEVVGNPVAVIGDAELAKYAQSKAWKLMHV
jgi:HAD superfamily hydrolase (TIGR01490 family)